MYTFTIIDILNSIGFGLVVSIMSYMFSRFAIGMWNSDYEHNLTDKEKEKQQKMIVCLSAAVGIGVFLISL